MVSGFVNVYKQNMCLLLLLSSHTDDATRVKLLEGPDYINANYVNVSVAHDPPQLGCLL